MTSFLEILARVFSGVQEGMNARPSGLPQSGQNLVHRGDHRVLLLARHFGKQREREALAADALGYGEVAFVMPEVSVRLLQVQGDRVVQAGLDAELLQFRANAVALRVAGDEEVPNVP